MPPLLSVSSHPPSAVSPPPSSRRVHARARTPTRIAASSSFSHSTPPPRAIIIGGGLAGLAAALRLHSDNIPFLLLEASDSIGGRVRTDRHRGFLLDRGFQILLTAYPEARRILDYPSLGLRPFYPGSLILLDDGRLHRVADPFRRPIDGLLSLANPVGTVSDKLRIGAARVRSLISPPSSNSPDLALHRRLLLEGYSSSIIDRFFRPFFGGIFFDTDLETSSRLFDFVFRCLALGENALPAGGIGAIPRQLAGRLPPGSVRLDARVESIEPEGRGVVLGGSGEAVAGGLGVIVAAEGPEAARLVPGKVAAGGKRSTACLYFAAERAAVEGPMLVLNGTGEGLVNNMCFPTSVAPTYGEGGRALVSVTVVGEREEEGDLEGAVARELAGWLGEAVVGGWEHLRTYRIGYAQPVQGQGWEVGGREARVGDGVYVCGDHWSSSTFDGALVSGRRAAEALLEDRGLRAAS